MNGPLKIDGRKVAAARDAWYELGSGGALLEGTASGQYLRNRLDQAINVGYEAGWRDALAAVAARIGLAE